MFGESFTAYEVGGISKKYVDMSESEFTDAEARQHARRRVSICYMLEDPVLTIGDASDPTSESGYPVDMLSERFLQTLYTAYRVVHVPAAGLASLERFLRSSDSHDGGSAAGGTAVADE